VSAKEQHQEQRSMLKPKEAQLLEYFLAHPSRVISAEELTQNIWTYDTIPTDATIRSHIRNLREIIGADKIVTQRGTISFWCIIIHFL
jgi:DNA-binding response OmpR family regulator